MIDYRAAYFNYMACYVMVTDVEARYVRLIEHLNEVEFQVMPSVPMDMNRKIDGHDLRYKYAFYNMIPYSVVDTEMTMPVSVLEVLVALSIKAEENTTYDGIVDHIHMWFWEMMHNIGLDQYDDVHYDEDAVDRLIRIFMNREYDEYGHGGPFTFDNPPRDVRQYELWYQMNWYARKFNS